MSEPDANNTQANDDMENTLSKVDITKKQKRGFPFLRVLFVIGIFIAIIYAVAKYYFSFYIFNEFYYAKVCYSWRSKYADEEAFKNCWVFKPANKYCQKSTKELYRLVKYAQIDRNLFDGHPIHAPRGQDNYFTHGGDHEFNLLLNEWRKRANDIDMKFDEGVYEGKILLTEKMKEWWVGTDPKNKDDSISIYEETDEKVKKFVWALAIFFNKIHNDYYLKQNAYIGEEISDLIIKDIKKIIDATGYVFREEPEKGVKPNDAPILSDDKAHEVIKESIKDFVLAKAKTPLSFAYSRCLYTMIWILVKTDLPIYAELEQKVNEAEGEKNKAKAQLNLDNAKKSGKFRSIRISRCIIFLLIKLMKHPYDKPDEGKNEFMKSIEKFFGPDYAKCVDDSEPLQKIIDTMNNTIGFIYDINNPDPPFVFTSRVKSETEQTSQQQRQEEAQQQEEATK